MNARDPILSTTAFGLGAGSIEIIKNLGLPSWVIGVCLVGWLIVRFLPPWILEMRRAIEAPLSNGKAAPNASNGGQ